MENAVEALKMAGSVLLFVLALSVAILAFSQSREAIDTILKYSDRESLTIEGDSRFYYLANSNDTTRYVGKETTIPAIYRAYKENYKIVFIFPDDYYLYKDKNGNEIKTIDLSKQSLGSDLESRQFLDGIIYEKYDYNSGKNLVDYKDKFSISPNTKGLFTYLTEKESSYKIKEELGTYYMEDLKKDASDTSTKSSIEDANKTEKRVITYTFIHK